MIPFLNSCIRKSSSSQVFIDNSSNLFEKDDNIPKEVIEYFIKNQTLNQQDKYKNRIFYKMQDKIRNLKVLDDDDFLRLYTFDEDEIIVLLKVSNEVISCLLGYLGL
jgi:predicted transcriptional regulator